MQKRKIYFTPRGVRAADDDGFRDDNGTAIVLLGKDTTSPQGLVTRR